jgi:sarcosine oxidase
MGPVTGPTRGAEANSAYRAFRLPDDWDVVVQESGGILMAEEAIRAFREGAQDRIVAAVARIRPTPTGIRVSTSGGEWMAKQVILACGPWISSFVPGLARHLKITRQAVGWFKPSRPETVAYGEFPIFIVEGRRGMVYGFPDFEGRGVKAAQHDHGPVVGADDWNPPATDEELEAVGATLAELVPGAAGSIVDRDICLYTNTLKGDVIEDGGDEFIIDRLPTDSRIIVASPCSGHGAKFASAIGSMLADLVLDPQAAAPRAFRLDRFSGSAPRPSVDR